jgi:hypothetical protein
VRPHETEAHVALGYVPEVLERDAGSGGIKLNRRDLHGGRLVWLDNNPDIHLGTSMPVQGLSIPSGQETILPTVDVPVYVRQWFRSDHQLAPLLILT